MKKVTRIKKPTSKSSVGDRIKYLRCNVLMSQDDLSAKIIRKREEITMYENGTRTPDIYTLRDIAKVFNVSTDYLLGLTEFENIDTNRRQTNDLIGLSDIALNNLININKYHNDNYLPIINYLLEQEKMFPDEYYDMLEKDSLTEEEIQQLSRGMKEWKDKDYKRLFDAIYAYFNVRVKDEDSIYVTSTSLKSKNEILNTQEIKDTQVVISSKEIADTYLLDNIKDLLKKCKKQYLEEIKKDDEE